MTLIQATLKEVASRGASIRDLLKPITHERLKGPAWKNKHIGPSVVIGTHEGGITTADYRNWRFSTFVPKTNASYFEKWVKLDDNQLFLNRAYLHIYTTDTATHSEHELIALHCDPNENGNTIEYKRCPHWHIVAAEPPFPKAHIPLNIVHIQNILSTVETFSEALAAAVVMLQKEVLGRLKDSSDSLL